MLVISYVQNMEVEYTVFHFLWDDHDMCKTEPILLTAEGIQFRKTHLIYLESHKEEETLV